MQNHFKTLLFLPFPCSFVLGTVEVFTTISLKLFPNVPETYCKDLKLVVGHTLRGALVTLLEPWETPCVYSRKTCGDFGECIGSTPAELCGLP